jgi:hypothetical protein
MTRELSRLILPYARSQWQRLAFACVATAALLVWLILAPYRGNSVKDGLIATAAIGLFAVVMTRRLFLPMGRNPVRAWSLLPLTERQRAIAWWWVSIGLPGAAMALALLVTAPFLVIFAPPVGAWRWLPLLRGPVIVGSLALVDLILARTIFALPGVALLMIAFPVTIYLGSPYFALIGASLLLIWALAFGLAGMAYLYRRPEPSLRFYRWRDWPGEGGCLTEGEEQEVEEIDEERLDLERTFKRLVPAPIRTPLAWVLDSLGKLLDDDEEISKAKQGAAAGWSMVWRRWKGIATAQLTSVAVLAALGVAFSSAGTAVSALYVIAYFQLANLHPTARWVSSASMLRALPMGAARQALILLLMTTMRSATLLAIVLAAHGVLAQFASMDGSPWLPLPALPILAVKALVTPAFLRFGMPRSFLWWSVLLVIVAGIVPWPVDALNSPAGLFVSLLAAALLLVLAYLWTRHELHAGRREKPLMSPDLAMVD